jgi:hypothetical protein
MRNNLLRRPGLYAIGIAEQPAMAAQPQTVQEMKKALVSKTQEFTRHHKLQ